VPSCLLWRYRQYVTNTDITSISYEAISVLSVLSASQWRDFGETLPQIFVIWVDIVEKVFTIKGLHYEQTERYSCGDRHFGGVEERLLGDSLFHFRAAIVFLTTNYMYCFLYCGTLLMSVWTVTLSDIVRCPWKSHLIIIIIIIIVSFHVLAVWLSRCCSMCFWTNMIRRWWRWRR